MPVIDLCHVSKSQRVALAQPVKIGDGRIVVPSDCPLFTIGRSRVERDGPTGNQCRDIDRIFDRHGTTIVFRGGIAGDSDGERIAKILISDADSAVDLRDVLRMAVAGHFEDRRGVGRGVDVRHVVGAGNCDHQVLGADIAVPVIDLCDISKSERVALAQPVEIGDGRVVMPTDGLLLAVGGERIETNGATGD